MNTPTPIDALTLKQIGYTIRKVDGALFAYKCFPDFVRMYDFTTHQVHHLVRVVDQQQASYQMNGVLWMSRSHGSF